MDDRKPKQANLRRAVSSVYYALFHYMVQEACKAQLGTQHGTSQYRRILARAFDHGSMKRACETFRGGNLPDHLCRSLPPAPHISEQPIKNLASTYFHLQGERHRADYDLTQPFHRSEVSYWIMAVRQAISDFHELGKTSNAKQQAERDFFLACLWAWPRLNQRG